MCRLPFVVRFLGRCFLGVCNWLFDVRCLLFVVWCLMLGVWCCVLVFACGFLCVVGCVLCCVLFGLWGLAFDV